MSRKRVAYYYDHDIGSYNYGLGHPMKPQRMKMTHELVSAYDMVNKMQILRPRRATAEAMTKFHTDEYVHFLERVTPETVVQLTYNGSRFLTGEDNPAFEGLFEFCSISAGGSISAAQRIAAGSHDIAIHWAGGLHHAKKREASGFCYINDIVLGILELLRTFPRVLYIDIDCHHGDGVEEAFYTTDRVMTCSFHKYGEYFPGTGTQQDQGRGKGKGYALNVPLRDGITDETFKSVFEPVVAKALEVFRPSVVVLQCGADSLSGDKLGCFNLTMHGHANCVKFVRNQDYPMILLGGGGYTVKNVARAWAYETACALGIEETIDENLPWNEYFEWFGPRYRLEVAENNMDDLNVKDGYLEMVRILALEQLSALPHAPSVGLHEVPSESLGAHLGLPETDELDEQLARQSHLVYKLQQESGTTTSESSEEDDDSSSSSSRVYGGTKKRMSIMTNGFHDVPSRQRRKEFEREFDLCSATATVRNGSQKRRFFQSSARWEGRMEKVLATNREIVGGLISDELMNLKGATAEVNGRKETGGRMWVDGDHTDDPDDGDEDFDDIGGDESGEEDFGGLERRLQNRHRMPLYY